MTNVTAFYFSVETVSKLKLDGVMRGNWWNILTLRDKFGKIPCGAIKRAEQTVWKSANANRYREYKYVEIQKCYRSVFCFCTVNDKLLLQITSWASRHLWPLVSSQCRTACACRQAICYHAKTCMMCTQHHVRVCACIACSIYITFIAELIAVLHHISKVTRIMSFCVETAFIYFNLKDKPNNLFLT